MKKNKYNYDELILVQMESYLAMAMQDYHLHRCLCLIESLKLMIVEGSIKGYIEAELDIKKFLWFFDCHFKTDPRDVPGCLGLDATVWQLVGFLAWCGNPGKGELLVVLKLSLASEVLQKATLVKYIIQVKRIIKKGDTCVDLQMEYF